ncbi:5-(carboxyamino)imidazole ribonucleotide synthase [Allosphingosinicella flava]|uniref:N5-carboxyaminoimidazole ribonucleotide synthase n=1 Tax=Allosphingosinicella flava TaxID=2771430 RepID=A0A7T2LLR6_9SPHN|nr:5-(carboxyamino)imidazole ribonucleotide synthase [Sphingosinicella flava]QPQ54714.1 5-(carboxyamino)imidazole ribonucleotide synthase [Sphingosinicella flava]
MIVPPGSIIGIIGGGQLGRMLAMAAAQLGYKVHIYAPEADSPAAEVSAFFTRGAYEDEAALARFAASVDVVTYEFENIPVAPLAALAARARLHPSPRALEIAQDRLAEKEFAVSLGGRPAPFAAVDSLEDLKAALDRIGTPAVLKTRRMGYDGKGQARLRTPADAEDAIEALGGAPAVLERFVAFHAEFSILLCRAASGETILWDAPRNTHIGGILDRSEAPAGIDLAPAIAEAADLAIKVADALDYVGVLTLEFFASADGPVFNEMAPRVHNSGHWTIEGAATSQFENHIRAICGLPLGATTLTAPKVEMTNLIGADADTWPDILSDPAAHLHLYGKGEGRAGRKMGHVTRLFR